MRMTARIVGWMFLFVFSSVYAEDKKEAKAEKFDAEKLVGKWSFVSGEKAGEKVDADRLKTQSVEITQEKLTLKGDATFVMKYEIDTKASPATIKLEITDSPFGAGTKATGIIELTKDEFKLCYADGEEAPKKFETKGTTSRLFVMKRNKDK